MIFTLFSVGFYEQKLNSVFAIKTYGLKSKKSAVRAKIVAPSMLSVFFTYMDFRIRRKSFEAPQRLGPRLGRILQKWAINWILHRNRETHVQEQL